MNLKIIPPARTYDKWGYGHYGAPRGERTHNGIDIACYPQSIIMAFKAGTVTKLGFPYKGNGDLRYVEITDQSGYKARYFYVLPMVELGDELLIGEIIGKSQALSGKYPGITEHIHFEVIGPDGKYIDPNIYYLRT